MDPGLNNSKKIFKGKNSSRLVPTRDKEDSLISELISNDESISGDETGSEDIPGFKEEMERITSDNEDYDWAALWH